MEPITGIGKRLASTAAPAHRVEPEGGVATMLLAEAVRHVRQHLVLRDLGVAPAVAATWHRTDGRGAGVGQGQVMVSRLPTIIPVIGSIARGTQRLNCSMRGSMGRAWNNSAVECRVL